MRLHQIHFDDVNEQDLQHLVDTSAMESIRLDFKQQLPVQEARDPDGNAKRELCRDVAAFANADGGDLLYGIGEEEGMATEVVGLPYEDQEKYRSKVEDILKDHIEPRISRVQTRFIPLLRGGGVFHLRVPRSLEAPHAVRGPGTWDFFMRRSTSKYPMSMSEVRNAFLKTQDWRAEIQRWHRSRIDMYEAGEGMLAMPGDGRLYVHVVPVGWSGEIDIENAVADWTWARELRTARVWGAMGEPVPTIEGLLSLRGNPASMPPQALALWTPDWRFEGVERLDFMIAAPPSNLAGVEGWLIEEQAHGYALAGVLSLAKLGIDGPYLVCCSLTGCKGRVVSYRLDRGFRTERTVYPLSQDTLTFMPMLVERATSELWPQLRPLLDRLGQAAGFPSSPSGRLG